MGPDTSQYEKNNKAYNDSKKKKKKKSWWESDDSDDKIVINKNRKKAAAAGYDPSGSYNADGGIIEDKDKKRKAKMRALKALGNA